MKKLFTSFISAMTIGAFSQCGFKSDNKAQSSTSANDNQKIEKKEKQNEAQTPSSSSSSAVKSSTRNQYLRKSHEEWIADSLSEMKSKLKDNTDYKDAFAKWKSSDDALAAKVNAYAKSDGFEEKLMNWQQANGPMRDSDAFVDSIATNPNTAKIYEDWTQSSQGDVEMRSIYDASPTYTTNYEGYARPISARSALQYAESSDSDQAFTAWRTSTNGIDVLKVLFKSNDDNAYDTQFDIWKNKEVNQKSQADYTTSGDSTEPFKRWIASNDGKNALTELFKADKTTDAHSYATKKAAWLRNLDAQIDTYIESDTSRSTGVYDSWKTDISNVGRMALEPLWKTTTSGAHNYDAKFKVWDGVGNSDNIIWSKFKFSDDQIPDSGRGAPTQLIQTWIDSDDGLLAIKQFVGLLFPGEIIPVSDDDLRSALKQSVDTKYRTRLKVAVETVIVNPDNKPAHLALFNYYNGDWKKALYNSGGNSEKRYSDLDLWTAGKKTTTTPDVKSKFIDAIKKPNSDEKRAFDAWKVDNINENVYLTSSSFKADLVKWAEGKKSQETPPNQNVKAKFMAAMISPSNNGDHNARDGYDSFKFKDKNAYLGTGDFTTDVSKWAEDKKTQTTNTQNVKQAFIDAMGSTRSQGNSQLKAKYVDWKTPSDEKYKKLPIYQTHFTQYLDSAKSEDAVKSRIKAIVAPSNTPTNAGNQALKQAFIAWQPTSKENFVKSDAMGSDFNDWLSTLEEVDPAILNEISKILKDKDLFTKTDGNSDFVSLLKEITKDSYDSYILTL